MMGSDATSADLLCRAREGNAEAAGALLELYRGYLTILARTQIGRRLQGKADAADLVQETFLEAHKHISRFRGQSEIEFLSWLRTILAAVVSNHVRHYLGTQQRDARLEQALVVELDNTSGVLQRGLIAADSTPSRQVANRETLLILANALEQLPDDYRKVIMLRHMERVPLAGEAGQLNGPGGG